MLSFQMANCCSTEVSSVMWRYASSVPLSPRNFTFPVDSVPVSSAALAVMLSPPSGSLSDKRSSLTSAPLSSSSTQRLSPDWQLDGKDDDYKGSLTTQSETNWQ